MLFGKHKTNPQLELKIDNISIERVYENTFLGVILDHKICWNPHIKHNKAKLAKAIPILNKSRHILNNKSKYILYNTLILPYWSYSVEIWGHTYTGLPSLHKKPTQLLLTTSPIVFSDKIRQTDKFIILEVTYTKVY